MKIKQGFVTNSSSTSFIVAFPYEVKTIEQVQKFIEDKYASFVFQDINGQQPFTHKSGGQKLLEFITEETKYGEVYTDIEEPPYFLEREHMTFDELYENPLWIKQAELENNKIEKIKTLNIIRSYKQQLSEEYYIYLFTYSDESGGIYAEMEHGDIFKELPTIIISKH